MITVIILISGALLTSGMVWAAWKVAHPRWFYCRDCGCYYNDLGERAFSPPRMSEVRWLRCGCTHNLPGGKPLDFDGMANPYLGRPDSDPDQAPTSNHH